MRAKREVPALMAWRKRLHAPTAGGDSPAPARPRHVTIDLDDEATPLLLPGRGEDEDAPAPALQATPAPAALQPAECSVDGPCEHAGATVASKLYHFTMLEVVGDASTKKPDEVGRQGFYEAIVRTYTYLYPGADHALHNGPEYGCVARELHCQSPLECRRRAHFHCASAFAVEHKWKAVERYLWEKEKIKVKSAPLRPLGGRGAD